MLAHAHSGISCASLQSASQVNSVIFQLHSKAAARHQEDVPAIESLTPVKHPFNVPEAGNTSQPIVEVLC